VGGLADVVKSPAYSTAVGLVKYGAEKALLRPVRKVIRPTTKVNASMFGWFQHWVRDVI
jgi:cell division ATPase FtsA